MKDLNVVILAAGKGTRMKSKIAKTLQKVAGIPMIDWIIESVSLLRPNKIIVVISDDEKGIQVKEELKKYPNIEFVVQKELLGSGHAVLQAKDILEDQEGSTLVMNGDTPLLTFGTLKGLVDYHEEYDSAATVMTAVLNSGESYGRIIRDDNGSLNSIVEAKDAFTEQLSIREVNTGVFIFENKSLFTSLTRIGNENAQKEFYITDSIAVLKSMGETLNGYTMKNPNEMLGVNSKDELSMANYLKQASINANYMTKNGLTLVDPTTSFLSPNISFGYDVEIEHNVTLKGKLSIGDNVKILSGSYVEGDVTIEGNVVIGPNAHIRPGSKIGKNSFIGNFVEVKNSEIGENVKVGHLTYVGDASISNNVNIGAGTVFANYDGKEKHRSTVGENSFVGSNSTIIAPISIEKNTVIAAGSTITENVEENDLAIGRNRQQNKKNYWEKFNK